MCKYVLIIFIHDLNDNNATNRLCFKLTPFQTDLVRRVSAKDWMDSREYCDDRDLGSDLRQAGDAYKLPTAHTPTELKRGFHK